MTTIYPTDTSGTKWHKLGEISKGLLQTPSEILVEYSDPQKFTSNSSLADAWSNRWAYNDTTSNVVLTIDPQLQVIGISAPAAMQIGQEAYLYQASTGTITIDKGANTIVGPLATTGAGQILVVKKIGDNSFYTYRQKKS